jgi:hypothetical protein
VDCLGQDGWPATLRAPVLQAHLSVQGAIRVPHLRRARDATDSHKEYKCFDDEQDLDIHIATLSKPNRGNFEAQWTWRIASIVCSDLRDAPQRVDGRRITVRYAARALGA